MEARTARSVSSISESFKIRLISIQAVWNFAYAESNRSIIVKDNGIEKLYNVLTETDDPILKKNIEGILYMMPATPRDLRYTIIFIFCLFFSYLFLQHSY